MAVSEEEARRILPGSPEGWMREVVEQGWIRPEEVVVTEIGIYTGTDPLGTVIIDDNVGG